MTQPEQLQTPQGAWTLQSDKLQSCQTENEVSVLQPTTKLTVAATVSSTTVHRQRASQPVQDLQSALKQPKLQRLNTQDINRVGFQTRASPIKVMLELNADETAMGNFNEAKYKSYDISMVPALKDLNTLPQTGPMDPTVESLPISNEERENVRTTQEVQTSFRPSVRDSHEGRGLGESLMQLSIDKEDDDQVEQEQNGDIMCEHIDISEMATQMLVSDQRVRMSPTTYTHATNLSTRRKQSRGSDFTQHLPRSNPTSSRGFNSSIKKAESPFQTQPYSKNQMLHQIYIQVNTSDNNMTFSGESITATKNHPMQPKHTLTSAMKEQLKLDSMHSPNATPMAELQQQSRNQQSRNQQAQGSSRLNKTITLKARRVSTQLLNANMQSTSSGKENGSLIVQPMLLGVRAFSRIKQEVQQQQQQRSNTICASTTSQQTVETNSKLKPVVSVKEFVFNNDLKGSRTQKMKNKHRKSRTQMNPSMTPASPLNQAPATSPTSMLSQTIVEESSSEDNKKIHLMIGPQIIQWLTPEQAANAQAQGLQIVTTDTRNDQMMTFQGNPIVIESHSKLGKHFMNETRKRKQMAKIERNVNLQQIKEKKQHKELVEYYRTGVTDNKVPMPPKAKFIDRKIQAQMKKEYQLHKLELQREHAWKEHQKEQKTAKNQTSFQSLTKQQVSSPDGGSPIPLSTFQEQPVTREQAELQPQSQNNIFNSADAYAERPQSAGSLNPWSEHPSLAVRAASSPRIMANISSNAAGGSQVNVRRSGLVIATEIAQAAEMARQMSPTSFQDIQNIIYKTLNQTDILMSPELQKTLNLDQSLLQQNPNAIVLRTQSMNLMAPILKQSQSRSTRILAPSQPASDAASARAPHENSNEVNDLIAANKDLRAMNTVELQEYGKQMKSLYLPFTLRKLYYKELMLRKPIFIGASKKGAGFEGHANHRRVNERTCQAQDNQQLLADHVRAVSQGRQRTSPGLQNDETFLTVSSARINRLPANRRKSPSHVHCKTLSPYNRVTKGDQGTQFERVNTDCIDKKNLLGGDKNSYDSIAGLDPGAVVELEHLIQSHASNHALQDTSKKTHEISTRPLGSGELTVGGRTAMDECTGVDARKSKVIFSVKKNNQSHSNCRRDNSSNVDKGQRKRGTEDSQTQHKPYNSSGYSYVSSLLRIQVGQDQPIPFTKHTLTEKQPEPLGSQRRESQPSKERGQTTTSIANEVSKDHQGTIMASNKRDFELQYESQIVSMQDQQLETDRSPDIAAEGYDTNQKATAGDSENLQAQSFNVGKIKIKVSKDGPMTSTPSPKPQKVAMTADAKSQSIDSKASPSKDLQSVKYLRSYTCADLENTQTFQKGLARRVRSAKNGNLINVQAATSAEEGGSGGKRSARNDDAVVNLNINSNSQSKQHCGRTNIDKITQNQEAATGPVPVSTSQTETEALGRQQSNQVNWFFSNNQNEDSAEMGSPIRLKQGKKLLTGVSILPHKEALSPNVVNLKLSKTASISPDRHTKDLPVTVRNQKYVQPKKLPQQKLPLAGLTLHYTAKPAINDTLSTVMEQMMMMMMGNHNRKRRERRGENQASRGSFHISEDSQRTLTPLTCKRDQAAAHFQGQVVHRDRKCSIAQQKAARQHHQKGNHSSKPKSKSHSRLSALSHHSKNVPQQEGTLPTRESRLRHHSGGAGPTNTSLRTEPQANQEQQPPCTCSLKGSFRLDKFDAMRNHLQHSGSNQANGGRNRVVFVMRNDEKTKKQPIALSQESGSNNMRQTNIDLAHLPKCYKMTEEHEQEGKVDESVEEDVTPASIARLVSNSKEEDVLLMKSALNPNMRTSDQKLEGLLIQSSNSEHDVRRSQPEMNRQTQQDVSEGAKFFTPQSSQRWMHMLPAVNSNGSFAQHVTNQSYGDIVTVQQNQIKRGDTLSKNGDRASKQTRSTNSRIKPNIQVKMRLSKNPNQCPPKIGYHNAAPQARKVKKNLKPRVKDVMQSGFNSSQKNKDEFADEEIVVSNRVIHVTVQNDQQSEGQKTNTDTGGGESVLKQIVLQHPGFNTLAPVSIISTDDLTKAVLNLADDKTEEARQSKTDHVIVADCSNKIEKLQSQPTLDMPKKIVTSFRPKSQRQVGHSRMSRLQRLYQTQRGRNIMSLVSSKRNTKARQEAGEAAQMNATSQRETLATLNQTANKALLSNAISTANASGPYILDKSFLPRGADTSSKASLKMIGKIATLRSSREISHGRHSRHKGQFSGAKVDVGSSIQRFSIHLSPKNQTVAIRKQHGKVDCELHKTMFFQKQQPQPTRTETSPGRVGSPLRNATGAKHDLNQDQKSRNLEHSRQYKKTSTQYYEPLQAQRGGDDSQQLHTMQPTTPILFRHDAELAATDPTSTVQSSAQQKIEHPAIEIPSETQNNQKQGVATPRNPISPFPQSATKSAKMLEDFAASQTVSRSDIYGGRQTVEFTRNHARPMTSAFAQQGHQRLRTQDDSDLQRNTLPSSGEFELSKGIKTITTKQSLQKRIVRGLATRHFTANLAAQGIVAHQIEPSDILEKRIKSGSATQNMSSRQKNITTAATLDNIGAAKRTAMTKKFNWRRAASKVTANSPMSNHQMDRTTTGSLVYYNSSEHASKTTALLKKHGRLLSPDLASLLQKDR